MSSTIQVRELGDTSRDLDRFWRVMVGISGAQAACVLPLRLEVTGVLGSANPFWSQARRRLWIAERHGRAVGRIAGIVSDEHQRTHGPGTAFFGYLECEDDPEAAGALFDTVAGWARAEGCRHLLGPMNPNINEECGLLVSGFERANSVMMPHTPPHLPRLVETAGFVKAKDLLVYDIDLARSPIERLDRFRKAAGRRAPEVRLTAVTRSNLARMLPALKAIYNEAWERNWSAVPMSGPEIDFLAQRLKPLLVEGLVWLAESSGQPAGLLLAIPDVNEVLGPLRGELLRPALLPALPMLLGWRRPRRFRLVALGVSSPHRRRGIEGMMFAETLAAARRLGFERCEASWILEDNRAVQQMVAVFDGVEVQRYRLYGREIGGSADGHPRRP
jgi:GNAT superfamily N-acetyltransferase